MEMQAEQIVQIDFTDLTNWPEGMTHSTVYQIETDISILKLWCDTCDTRFICMAQAAHICPQCEIQNELPYDLRDDQFEFIMYAIESCTEQSDIGEINREAEAEAHDALRNKLNEFVWWYDIREQIQEVWYRLRLNGTENYPSAQRYLKREYCMAYHRDDY